MSRELFEQWVREDREEERRIVDEATAPLREEIERLQRVVDNVDNLRDEYIIMELRAEIERLRAALKALLENRNGPHAAAQARTALEPKP